MSGRVPLSDAEVAEVERQRLYIVRGWADDHSRQAQTLRASTTDMRPADAQHARDLATREDVTALGLHLYIKQRQARCATASTLGATVAPPDEFLR